MRKGGTFWVTFWCTLPEERPTTGRPVTERPGWRPTTGRPGWMASTGRCRTRGSRTGKSCRSGRRLQSDVRSLPTITVWNRRTMGSTDNPKRSTTEPLIGMGTSDGDKDAAATTAGVCWSTAARICWSTAARVNRPTAARFHWSTAARVQRVPLTDREWENCKLRRHRFGFMQRCGIQRARAGDFRLRCWWILRRAEQTTCRGSSSNPSNDGMVGESR